MSSVLYLVRHAMPVPIEDVAKDEWELSPDGRAAARQLVARLPADASWVSSNERKAWETLADAPSEITRDAGFNEVHREDEPWEGNFRRLRRAYVEGRQHPGWEPHSDAAARFQAGVTAALAVADGRDVVVATHGMVLTTWLVSRGTLAVDAAGGFWEDLGFPDCVVVENDGSQLSRLTV